MKIVVPYSGKDAERLDVERWPDTKSVVLQSVSYAERSSGST